MPANAVHTIKLLRHDRDVKVSFAFFGTGMTCVQVALIFNQQL